MKYGLPEETIDKICDVFSRYPHIDKAVLYGSRAKGTFRNGSDIDISLAGEGIDLSLLNDISENIDELLLPYTVDLSSLSLIDNTDLLEHIHRVGIVLYQR